MRLLQPGGLCCCFIASDRGYETASELIQSSLGLAGPLVGPSPLSFRPERRSPLQNQSLRLRRPSSAVGRVCAEGECPPAVRCFGSLLPKPPPAVPSWWRRPALSLPKGLQPACAAQPPPRWPLLGRGLPLPLQRAPSSGRRHPSPSADGLAVAVRCRVGTPVPAGPSW